VKAGPPEKQRIPFLLVFSPQTISDKTCQVSANLAGLPSFE